MTISIDTEFKNLIPSLTDEEFAGLEASILEEGRARVPLDVWNGILIDGHNRFTICQCHDLPFTTQEVGTPDWTRTDAMIWIIQNQFNRRNLSMYARTELALKLKPLVEEKAKENLKLSPGGDGSNQHASKGYQISDNLCSSISELTTVEQPTEPTTYTRPVAPKPAIEPVHTLKEVAKAAGVSHDTMHKAAVIAAKADDATKEKLRRGETTINRECKEIVKEEKQREREERHAEVVAATPKDGQTSVVSDINELVAAGRKFGCIYADPPWVYDNQGTRAATSNHYSGLTVQELCALPVRELAADDAHLHLWTTNAFLFDCPRILAAWGFEFRSTFIWTKPQMGIGNYWRNSHEILLTAIRGDVKQFNDHSMMSWIQCDRAAHSAKPEQVRAMIERASDGPYFEMFGRRVAQGWTVWGNQIEKQDLFANGVAA